MPNDDLIINVDFDTDDAESAIKKLKKQSESYASELNKLKAEYIHIYDEIEKIEKAKAESFGKSLDPVDNDYFAKWDLHLKTLYENLDIIESSIDELKAKFEAVTAQIEEAETNSAKLEETLSNVDIANDFEKLEQNIESVNEQLEEVETTSTSLKGTLDNIDISANLGQAEQTIESVNEQLEIASENFSEVSNNVNIDENVSDAEQKIKSINEQIETYKSRQEEITAEIERQNAIIAEQEDVIKNLYDYFSNVSGKFTEVGKSAYEKASKPYVETLENAKKYVSELSSELEDAKSKAQIMGEYLLNLQKNAIKIPVETEGLDEASEGANRLSIFIDTAKKKIEELKKSESDAGSSGVLAFANMGKSIDKFTTKLKNMISRFIIMRTLYAIFNKLKEVMSAVVKNDEELSNGINQLRSNLLIAFYPVIELITKGLTTILPLINKASIYIAAFIHTLTGADINNSIKNAEKLFNTMNGNSENEQNKKKIENQIEAYKKSIKVIEDEEKALKKSYEAQKKIFEQQKQGYQDQIDLIDVYLDYLENEYNKENEVYEKRKKELDNLIDSIDEYLYQLEREYKAQDKIYQNQINGYKAQIAVIDDYIDALEKEYKNQDKIYENQIQSYKEQKEIKDDIIDDTKDQIDERKKQLKQERDNVDEEIKIIEKDIDALKKQREAREKELKGDQKSLASFDTLNILSGTEDEDETIRQIDEQIEALEDKKDALEEVKDAIPDESNDPLIIQLEAQIKEIENEISYIDNNIKALERLKDKLKDDYDLKISAKEDEKDSIEKQIDKIETLRDKLKENYELKVSAKEDEEHKIQTQIKEIENLQDKLKDDYELKVAAKEEEKFTINQEIAKIDKLRDKLDEKYELDLDVKANAKDKLQEQIDKLNEEKSAVEDLIKAADNGGKEWIPPIEAIDEDTLKSFDDMSDKVEALIALFGLLTFTVGLLTGDPVKTILGFSEIVLGMWDDISKGASELWSALKKGFKEGFENLANHVRGFWNYVKEIINWFIKKINDKFHLNIDLLSTDSIPQSLGPYMGYPSEPFALSNIPPLAQGAVIPGGKPFLAMLGDQPSGQTNIEAPLSTIKQAVREEGANSHIDVTVNFEGSEGQFIRSLNPKITVTQRRNSAFA